MSLAELVARREVTTAELLELALAATEAVNAEISAASSSMASPRPTTRS